MAAPSQFVLRRDARGALWDLLLYVPTVVALASVGAKLWFGGDHSLAYLLSFLASFFFIVGANRVLKTRLLLLPAAPVRVELTGEAVAITQRSGTRVDLVKDQRLYTDYAGRSFGISGLDGNGRRLQFVLHRGQFGDLAQYEAIQEALRRLMDRARRR